MASLAYAIITLGNATLTGVMSGWLLYFYLPPGEQPLVPLALYGIVIFFSRAIYISSNLLTDYFIQRTHSPWGRKLPYIVGGALFMPFLFILLWTSPQPGESTTNLLYLFLTLTGFNIVCAVHQTPYEGLLPELAVSEKERAAISSWKMIFLLGGNILTGFAGPLIEAFGYVQTMWIFLAVVAPCLILPGLFLRRQVRREMQPAAGQVSFFDHMKSGLKKPAFRVFALSWGLMWLATTFTFETLPYIVTEICRLSRADSAYLYFAALLTSLLAYPVAMRLAERYGPKTVFRASLLAGAISMPGLMLVSEQIPIPLLAQGILWMVLQAASLVGAQALPGIISAQIGAEDQSAFGNLVDQLASGLALAIIPFFLLLGRSQFDPGGPLGVRLLGPLGGIFLLGAVLVFGRYTAEKTDIQPLTDSAA
jgi:glycoside/pentoside/hexuronide:cation symporter, GPH family